MQLPFINRKKQKEEYYLALLLAEEKVSAIILKETEEKLKLIGKHEEIFSQSIEHLQIDEMTDIVDKTVSRAEAALPPDIETHKTVFGVKESWVEKETKKIQKQYLTKLKKVCDSLDLSPVGFMVISEAIANLLQEEEGAPLSAIVTEIGKKQVTLTLFRGGNILQTVNGHIEGTVEHTVDRLLKHFTVEVLPARIILYDSDTTETLAQKFISHQWSKSLPFLHMPQISVLSQGFDARAVTHGAAEQMGLKVLGEVKGADIETFDHQSLEKAHHSDNGTPPLHTPEQFGFVIGEDVGMAAKAETQKIVGHPLHTVQAVQPVHVSDNLKLPEDTVGNIGEQNFVQENFEPLRTEETYEEEPTGRSKSKRKKSLPSIGSLFSFMRFPKFHIGGKGMMKLILFLSPVLLLVFLTLGGIFYYMYKVSAIVSLSIKPEMVSIEQNVTFSNSDDTDFSKNIIGAEKVTASVDGSATETATGTQQIGEKAKGTVTFYNSSTNSEVSISSGTSITSSNNLKFIVDKDVKVASASGDIFSGTKPGTTDVSVTASQIGTDSNLPSGTKFSVEGNSNLAAKNGSAFSGGTKKDVTVVSKNDLINLKSKLEDALQGKANNELMKQASGNEMILPVVLSTSMDQAKFDKKEGDQAKSVSVKGTVTFTGLSYNQEDITLFTKDLLEKKYKEDVTVDEKTISTALKEPKEKDKVITAILRIEAGLFPKLNSNDVARKLSGKSMKEVKDILSDLPQVSSSEITYSPNLYFLSQFLPQLPNQVKVIIHSNE